MDQPGEKFYTLTFVIIVVFQAAGRGVEPFIRATIVSESAALMAGAVMLAAFWKKTS